MRIQRNQDAGGADLINITPIVDLMFTLIIFFLVTTTFQQAERDVNVTLPEIAEGQSLTAAGKVIVVNVRRDGSLVVDGKDTDLSGLRQIVAQAVAADKEQKVLVRGDRNAAHGSVADALAHCRLAGVGEANIGYKLPDEYFKNRK